MARFYAALELHTGQHYALPEGVVRHLNVLRSRTKQQVILFNGNGFDYTAELVELTKRSAEVFIQSAKRVENEAKAQITLLLSLLASDKFDLVIQKAVELGVSQITPLYSQNTQRFDSAKLEKRLLHWRNIIIAASEQCGRARLAVIEPPLAYEQALDSVAAEVRLVLSPRHGSASKIPSATTIALLLGPEGGFTENEIKSALAANFQALELGPRILRAETAAIAAVCYVHSWLGDFS